MTYSSTVTIKGTITLPASIRKKYGITPGQRVDISHHGDVITIKAQSGWDEFFTATADFGKQARDMIARGEAKPLLTNEDIEQAAQLGRQKGY